MNPPRRPTHEPGVAPSLEQVPAHLGPRARRAFERARDDAAAWGAEGFGAERLLALEAAIPLGVPLERPRLRVAIGDPQAPLATFLEILDRNDLLSGDGRLHPHVLLVSMGDHFDWGPASERAFAAENSVRTMSWLAAHPASQVVLLAGNHDLARVGELAGFDDATFAAAHEEATALRAVPMHTPGRHERRRAFLERHRSLPGVGVAARDWSGFEARQRSVVGALLIAGRFRAAWAAAPDLLLVHGAITSEDLDLFGLPREAHADAVVIGEAFQEWFEDAIEAWAAPGTPAGAPLVLEPLYRIGDAERGESRGIFVQRPADPDDGHDHPHLFEGPPRRRFDPRTLTPGLAQVTGHIRDAKCRDLLRRWSDPGRAVDGPLRHLWTDGSAVRYALGVPGEEARAAQAAGRAALMHFTDGGMNHADPARYELLDLDARQPLSAGSTRP
jgi:hypothetical protein